MSTSLLVEPLSPALESNTSSVHATGTTHTEVDATSHVVEVDGRSVTGASEPASQLSVASESSAQAVPVVAVVTTTKTTTETTLQAAEAMEVDQNGSVSETGDKPEESMDVEASISNPSPVFALTLQDRDDHARAVELAKRRLQIQIQFVENARECIEQETHPDFVARMGKIDAERERLLDEAERHNVYWQHCTSVVHVYEREEAESDYVLHCESLRQEMLDEIQHEVDLINDQRNGVVSARKTTRKTRSSRGKGGSDDRPYAFDAAQRVKNRWGNVYQVMENRLAQSEVDRDLQELEGAYESMAKKRRIDAPYEPDLPYLAKHYRASLLYRDEVFQEGDQVFIRNFMTGSEYLAILCSITSTELFVLSEKGKYHRLVIMDLRQGRVVVTPLSPAQLAALDEHDGSRN